MAGACRSGCSGVPGAGPPCWPASSNMLICGSAQDLEVRDPSAPMPQSNYVGAAPGRDLPESCTVLIKNLKSTGANLARLHPQPCMPSRLTAARPEVEPVLTAS